MREQFQILLQKWGPKHWSFGLRRDPDLMAWIIEQTVDLPETTSLAERVHCAISGERAACPLGFRRKFKSIVDGWAFCGPAGRCACAREQVSRSVSASKKAASQESRAITQSKREATNLERYGHINTGQTEAAREAHRAFYSDLDNVRNQLRKQVATMMELYGVENAAHLREVVEKRETTVRERYGVANPMQNKSIAARSVSTRLVHGYAEDYYRGNYNRLKQRILDDFRFNLMTPYENYGGSASRPPLDLQCIDCGRKIIWRLFHRTPRCQICNPADVRYKSKEEMALFQFIKDKLAIDDLISGDRQLIAPYEIDILSDRNRVAIEYGGLYWHAERQRPSHIYHLDKLQLVERQGYRLLTIFSDEWLDHPDIVKSKICHLFHRIEDRRFARKLTISEIDSNAASAFYEVSHIQGGTRASHNLALLDGDEVVAVMSFTAARPSQGLPDNSYDLVRFATLPYTTVVGGASRLFNRFVKIHDPAAVISYADRRWSDGGLYRQLGFTMERMNPPSYSYVENYTKRHFRFNFRKEVLESILGATDETEWAIMQRLDYDRIWDCGTYRFVWRG